MMKKTVAILGLASLTAFSFAGHAAQSKNRVNILLIVADDMNYDAVGAFGCQVPNTTPNIDKLAAQGLRFTNAHVSIAVCQPSRGAIMTGMYGIHSGIEGFEHYLGNKKTLTEYLRDAGYMTGMLGKVSHSMPKYDTELKKFDLVEDMFDLGMGRDPGKYYQYMSQFLKMVNKEHKPFFMMANSHDPHRPFAGSADEKTNKLFVKYFQQHLTYPNPSKIFKSDEIVVPGFLPDLPNIRTEIAQYYSSVRRCDDTVGKILQALKESGLEGNTLIVFISDNGMAFPYAKTNCYLNSTKTPFIAKWPRVIKPGVNDKDFISGIDFLPTFLDAAGVSLTDSIDGFSFLPLLEGKQQKGREEVFTQFYETSARNRYPMRAVQSKHYGYIFNPWSDGKRVFKNESQAGLTFKAMEQAAPDNKNIEERVDFFVHRTVEEFYDLEKDPDALHNLVDDPTYQKEVQKMRNEMKNWMIKNKDYALDAYEHRNSKEKLGEFMEYDAKRALARHPLTKKKKIQK